MEYVLNIVGLPKISLRKIFAPLGFFAVHLHDHFIPHARNNYLPHILHHCSLALMSALLVSVKIFSIALISFGPIAPAFSLAITQGNIINLTNESRARFNLKSLKFNPLLHQAAQAKAEDMLAKGYFAHTTPDGKSPWEFIVAAGYSYLVAGENLAVNFTQAENVESAWMNSPGHKANIINKDFEEIGIGVAQGEYQGHTAIFVVQMFGTPAQQQVAISSEPTPVRKFDVPAPNQSLRSGPGRVPSELSSADVAGQAVAEEKVVIQNGEVKFQGDSVGIVAQILGPAVKVVAYFGHQAIMLSPKDQLTWTGNADVATLAQGNLSVKLKAFAMDGQNVQLQLADFTANLSSNYNLSEGIQSEGSKVSFLNREFDPKIFENRFYLLFLAGTLSCIILAIAIKRHVQHVGMIANASFVSIFAALLFWTG